MASLNSNPPWMPPADLIWRSASTHLRYPFYGVQLLTSISRHLPQSGACSILDIGAGSGWIGEFIQHHRPDTTVIAVETYLRPTRSAQLSFVKFNGAQLPFRDRSFDCTLALNVLHHSDDPHILLGEMARVTRDRIVIKDHLEENALDRLQLLALDVLGNAGSGAVVTGRYLSASGWEDAFRNVSTFTFRVSRETRFRRGPLALLFPNSLEVVFAGSRIR